MFQEGFGKLWRSDYSNRLEWDGKSSAIQALLMMAQSLSDDSSKGRLLTKGKYIDLGMPSDVLHDYASTNSIGIRISGAGSRATFKLRAQAPNKSVYSYSNIFSALRLETLAKLFVNPHLIVVSQSSSICRQKEAGLGNICQ